MSNFYTSLRDKAKARFGKPPVTPATPPPAGPGGTPRAPGQAGLKTPAEGLRRVLSSAPGKFATKVVKGVGKIAAPVAIGSAGVSAVRSYNTPTDVYAKRYGEQAGEGVMSDLGIRARGVGEDLVNALNPFSSDTFGTGADKPASISPIRAASADTSAERMKTNAATYAAGTEKPLGQITPDTGVRSRIVQDGKNSFSDGIQNPPDVGKKGGGLSVVGSISPERAAAISQANADLQEAREAASIGISTEQYRRQKAKRATDSEIAGLTQNGLGLREATARVFDRNAALEAEAASGGGGLSASDQIALMGLQQRVSNQDANLGLRRDQFALNQEQVGDQKDAAERTATAKYIAQLNNEDPGVASSARGQLLQSFLQNPDSAEGKLLLSQASQALRQRGGTERGLIDAGVSAFQGSPQYPGDLTLDDFVLEPGFAGEGASGTIVKDKNGQVLGNLDDLPPEYAEAIRTIHSLRNPQRGLR